VHPEDPAAKAFSDVVRRLAGVRQGGQLSDRLLKALEEGPGVGFAPLSPALPGDCD